MRRLASFLTLLLLIAAILLLAPIQSFAACHFFTVTVDPSSVTEGGTINVTVGRDATLGPSSVQVTSSDETATGDVDYEKVNRRIEFTSERTQTFSVATKEDRAHEGDETFLLRVSNGGGCTINSNFRYGEPARVQIQDNDSAPPPPVTGGRSSGTTTRSPKAGTSPSPASSPEVSPEPAAPAVTGDSPTPSPSPTLRSLARAESDEGASGPLIIAAVALIAAGAAGAGLWWLRRRSA